MNEEVLKHGTPVRSETILFVGAGATASLAMPTTEQQADFLWKLCDENLTDEEIKEKIKSIECFRFYIERICDLLHVLDSGESGVGSVELNSDWVPRAFPDVASNDVEQTVLRLRKKYDWYALKLIASAKKGLSSDDKARENYLQEVFTLIDACLREDRGFMVYSPNSAKKIFLSVDRLKAARECLIYLINTAFACAWKNLLAEEEWETKVSPYIKFCKRLAQMMQEEGVTLANVGKRPDKAEFYKLSYSIVTTNFEPLFLWFVWQGHNYVNHECDLRVGDPGRKLKLLMNFPSTVGMRKPADPELESCVWFPCTDAVAQSINNEKYAGERFFRLGMYSPVHGMTNFRHCPICGRLNFYPGDTWDEKTTTLFPNGIIKGFDWGQKPRTKQEIEAHKIGEYDALECHFCGTLTYSYDNFMFMQTQLKTTAPSFIKEMTDDALSQIAGAKHIVLLGYSLPLDDAIWGSLLTVMSRRPAGERLYCSVVGFVSGADDKWISGEDMYSYVEEMEKDGRKEDVRCIRNAMTVFGKENVRAYMKGVPNVFRDFSEQSVRSLMFPSDTESGWKISSFQTKYVVRN